MSTLLAIVFWIFVYYCWREGRKPTCEITGKEIAKQEALIATLRIEHSESIRRLISTQL
jgi:hypothetical protein